jgi:VanZ family protein
MTSFSFSLRWTACVLYTAVIVVFSLISSSSLESFSYGIPFEDKIGHFGVYGLYTALILWAVRGTTTWPESKMWIQDAAVFVYGTAYGILMEILQPIVQAGDRQFSIGDIIADAAGVMLSCLAMHMLYRLQGGTAEPQTPADADRSV